MAQSNKGQKLPIQSSEHIRHVDGNGDEGTLAFAQRKEACDCEALSFEAVTTTGTVYGVQVELLYNTKGHGDCSQKEDAHVVRHSLYEFVPIFAKLLGKPTPSFPPEGSFHVNCSSSAELSEQFEQLLEAAVLRLDNFNQCGCESTEGILRIYDESRRLIDIANQSLGFDH
ncbi:hypothetical protein QR680_008947 [Steinernema hermaphroditum]|uniref:Uncharacterized protein n=1 Tax=Steinernema hermaphroditum TaxID=289476 RepID=A0AA39IK03_9BILA|nr:hypothetical protein QR680_008947 [Steinernema hermaphroditum]